MARPVLPRDGWLSRIDEQAARQTYHYETSPRARIKYLLNYTLPIELRHALINSLFAAQVGDPRQFAGQWYLDGAAVSDLDRAGHTIGGHGFAHEPYNRLSGAQQLRDLWRSAAVLRGLLGPDVRPFSYPFGGMTETVARRCAEAGYVQAFTTQPGWIRCDDDPHRLCRLDTINVEAFVTQELTCLQL